MSTSQAGNIEAIRDWSKRFFYTKEEINLKFIDGVTGENKSDFTNIQKLKIKGNRYVRTDTTNAYSGFAFTPLNSSGNVFTNPFGGSNNDHKISIRFKVLFDKSTGDQCLLDEGSKTSDQQLRLPNIIYFNHSTHPDSMKKTLQILDYNANGDARGMWLTGDNAKLVVGNTYRVDYKYVNGVITGSLYDDGDVLIKSVQSGSAGSGYLYDTSWYYSFGNQKSDSFYSCPGIEYDLYNTYWTVNNEIVWGCDALEHEKET